LPSSSSLRSRRGRRGEEEEENDDDGDDDDDADDEFAFRRRRYLLLRISSSFEREKLLLKHIYERIVAKRVSSTNAKTHICEDVNTRVFNNSNNNNHRAIEKRRKKERGKTNSLSCSPVFSRTTFSSNSRGHERNSIGVCIGWCVREKARAQWEGSGAIVSKFPSRRLITKIFACARQRYARTRAHARSKRKHEPTSFLFLSSPSTSVVAHHRVSRVVHSSYLI
jgi:hypothetical protein